MNHSSDQRPVYQSEYRKISLCHANIQSLGSGDQGVSATANVKMDQIRTILCNKFEVICLSETWLNNNVPDNDVNLDEYTLYRRDRGS